MKYAIGIFVIIIGCFLIIKTEWFIQNFGTSEWSEQHLGSSGGTRTMYKIIGLVMIFLAMAGMTGLLGGMIMATFGRLFTFGQ